MDRFLNQATRSTSLPPGFRLTVASLHRPFTELPSFIGKGGGSLGLWSASFLAASPSPENASPLTKGSGCPWIDWPGYLPSMSPLISISNRFQSWWSHFHLPSGGSGSNSTSVVWPKEYLQPSDCQCQEPKFDYVRIMQILISLAGIGLSLSLMYYLIEQINPTAKEKRLARKRAQQLFSSLGIHSMPNLTDYEVGVAVNLVDTRVLTTDWDAIGGLDTTIEDLKESVIQPFQKPQLLPYPSRLLQPPKGVLLFGPPGCGKTMLARAMARAAKAYFINLQISTLVNMWYGETQKYVEATFTLAYKLQPSIIFIDELDSFLTTRSYTDNESTRMIKTQFMALWDGLLTSGNSRVLIVGATNRPEDLDQAILRRLPFKIAVPMPGQEQRLHILRICLLGEPLARGLSEHDLKEISSRTEGLSGSDLQELSREAAFCCYRQEKDREIVENIRLKREHFFIALQKFLRNRVGARPPQRDHIMPLD